MHTQTLTKSLLTNILLALSVALVIGGLLTPDVKGQTLRLPVLFSIHMVLQRDTPVPVWSETAVGDTVRVQLGGQQAVAVTGSDRQWEIELPTIHHERTCVIARNYAPRPFAPIIGHSTDEENNLVGSNLFVNGITPHGLFAHNNTL